MFGMMAAGTKHRNVVTNATIFPVNSSNLNGSSMYYASPVNSANADFTCSIVANIDGSASAIDTFFSETDKDSSSQQRYSLRNISGDLYFDMNGGTSHRNIITQALSGFNMLTYTYTTGEANLYLNGSLISTLSATMNAASSQPLYFGLLNVDNLQHLDGFLSFASLHSRELSASECLELANLNGSTPEPKCFDSLSSGLKTNLEGYWNLGNTAGSTLPSGQELTDQSGNTNTMVNVGSIPFTGTGLNVECT